MDLTHESITSHQFDLNRRGYDPDAVDAHLREIAAAVAARESEIAGLRRTITELDAKVQDASESEEALRLTLKAAAHAKEELLAGARQQAATMEEEASTRAQQLVADAEAKAKALTDQAQARADAMTHGATEQARQVAQAALSESELQVVRIEQLRAQVQSAEESLRVLGAEASPRLGEARQALDKALEAARASAENPELLAAAVSTAPPPPPPPAPENVSTSPAVETDTVSTDAAATPPAAPAETQHAPDGDEPESEQHQQAADDDEATAPQLEVVAEPGGESKESSSDISNKVDRLLEELREVT